MNKTKISLSIIMLLAGIFLLLSAFTGVKCLSIIGYTCFILYGILMVYSNVKNA